MSLATGQSIVVGERHRFGVFHLSTRSDRQRRQKILSNLIHAEQIFLGRESVKTGTKLYGELASTAITVDWVFLQCLVEDAFHTRGEVGTNGL